jgi:hypothetical protein
MIQLFMVILISLVICELEQRHPKLGDSIGKVQSENLRSCQRHCFCDRGLISRVNI